MSLNQLHLDIPKPWLNARVCNLTVDCDATIPNLAVNISQIESTGSEGFLVDNGTEIERRDIELEDLQGIGGGAPLGPTFLKHEAGVVSFASVGGGAVNLYTVDGVVADPVREVDVDGNDLLFRNPNLVQIGESTDAYLQVTQDFGGSGQPGAGFTKMVGAANYFIATGDLGSGGTSVVGYNDPGVVFNSCEAKSDGVTVRSSDFGASEEFIRLDAITGSTEIKSSSLILTNSPPASVSSSVLVRNFATGRIETRFDGSLPNIYTADGTLSGDRVVNANSHGINIIDPSRFRIGPVFTDGPRMDFNPASSGVIGYKVGPNTPSAIQFTPANVNVTRVNTGNINVLLMNDTASLNSNRGDADLEEVSVRADIANNHGTQGIVSIRSNDLRIVKLPPASTSDTVLVRNANSSIGSRSIYPNSGCCLSLPGGTPVVGDNVLIYSTSIAGSFNTGVYNVGTGDLTVPAGGAQIWDVEASVGYEENGAHGNLNQVLRIRLNGVAVSEDESVYSLNNNDIDRFSCRAMISCTTGDVISVVFVNAGSGTTDLLSAGAKSLLIAKRA